MQTTFTNAGTVPEMEERITSVLKTCYDPEIPVDIFELGLIYTVAIDAENNVQVEMTLTSPNCPAAGTLPGEVEQRLADIPDVKSCLVDVVFDPPWERSNMSEVAMLELGFM
jgi:FeS assembly SUF system protein